MLFLGQGHLSHVQLPSIAYSSLCRVKASWAFLSPLGCVHSRPGVPPVGQVLSTIIEQLVTAKVFVTLPHPYGYFIMLPLMLVIAIVTG